MIKISKKAADLLEVIHQEGLLHIEHYAFGRPADRAENIINKLYGSYCIDASEHFYDTIDFLCNYKNITVVDNYDNQYYLFCGDERTTLKNMKKWRDQLRKLRM